MKPNWTHIRVPDSGFIKDLHAIDPQLDIFWDAIFNDWVIIRHGMTGNHEIAHYKTLDNRVLASLYEGDLWRRKNPKEFEEYIDKYNNKIKEDTAKKVHESNIEFARKTYVDAGIREHKTQF